MQTVRMVTEGGHSLAQVARDLGVRPDMLRRWRRQIEEDPKEQCDRLNKRLVSCSCFGVPFCFGLFNCAVALCDAWQKGCPPCPPPPAPVVDYAHGHGNCKPGQEQWHYFEYHQGPPPQCICRKVRRFGGCM